MTVLPVVTGFLYRLRTQTIIRQKVYLSSESANSDFPFTLYVLPRHYTTGGTQPPFFPLRWTRSIHSFLIYFYVWIQLGRSEQKKQKQGGRNQRRIQTGARGARAPTSRKKKGRWSSFARLHVYPCLAWDWPRRAKFLLGLLSRFRHPDKPVPVSQNERTCAQTEPDEDVPPSGFNTETHWTLRLKFNFTVLTSDISTECFASRKEEIGRARRDW